MQTFNVREIDLAGAYLIENFMALDNRGRFTKIFESDFFIKAGINMKIDEVFVSKSVKNTIRGLHFQSNNPQTKLVSVINGKAYDVLVDLRVDSLTFGQWRGFELSEENGRALYIPKGFAHGFLALEDNTTMIYQCEGAYDAISDTGIRYNDIGINVKWPINSDNDIIISERDLSLMTFDEYIKNYNLN